MPIEIIFTVNSFLNHNLPLVVYGALTFLALLLTVLKPSRTALFLFLGFLLLTLNFEYEKHLLAKIIRDMLDLMFPMGTRFTKYALIKLFLETIVPVTLTFVGWGLIALSVFLSFFQGLRRNS